MSKYAKKSKKYRFQRLYRRAPASSPGLDIFASPNVRSPPGQSPPSTGTPTPTAPSHTSPDGTNSAVPPAPDGGSLDLSALNGAGAKALDMKNLSAPLMPDSPPHPHSQTANTQTAPVGAQIERKKLGLAGRTVQASSIDHSPPWLTPSSRFSSKPSYTLPSATVLPVGYGTPHHPQDSPANGLVGYRSPRVRKLLVGLSSKNHYGIRPQPRYKPSFLSPQSLVAKPVIVMPMSPTPPRPSGRSPARRLLTSPGRVQNTRDSAGKPAAAQVRESSLETAVRVHPADLPPSVARRLSATKQNKGTEASDDTLGTMEAGVLPATSARLSPDRSLPRSPDKPSTQQPYTIMSTPPRKVGDRSDTVLYAGQTSATSPSVHIAAGRARDGDAVRAVGQKRPRSRSPRRRTAPMSAVHADEALSSCIPAHRTRSSSPHRTRSRSPRRKGAHDHLSGSLDQLESGSQAQAGGGTADIFAFDDSAPHADKPSVSSGKAFQTHLSSASRSPSRQQRKAVRRFMDAGSSLLFGQEADNEASRSSKTVTKGSHKPAESTTHAVRRRTKRRKASQSPRRSGAKSRPVIVQAGSPSPLPAKVGQKGTGKTAVKARRVSRSGSRRSASGSVDAFAFTVDARTDRKPDRAYMSRDMSEFDTTLTEYLSFIADFDNQLKMRDPSASKHPPLDWVSLVNNCSEALETVWRSPKLYQGWLNVEKNRVLIKKIGQTLLALAVPTQPLSQSRRSRQPPSSGSRDIVSHLTESLSHCHLLKQRVRKMLCVVQIALLFCGARHAKFMRFVSSRDIIVIWSFLCEHANTLCDTQDTSDELAPQQQNRSPPDASVRLTGVTAGSPHRCTVCDVCTPVFALSDASVARMCLSLLQRVTDVYTSSKSRVRVTIDVRAKLLRLLHSWDRQMTLTARRRLLREGDLASYWERAHMFEDPISTDNTVFPSSAGPQQESISSAGMHRLARALARCTHAPRPDTPDGTLSGTTTDDDSERTRSCQCDGVDGVTCSSLLRDCAVLRMCVVTPDCSCCQCSINTLHGDALDGSVSQDMLQLNATYCGRSLHLHTIRTARRTLAAQLRSPRSDPSPHSATMLQLWNSQGGARSLQPWLHACRLLVDLSSVFVYGCVPQDASGSNEPASGTAEAAGDASADSYRQSAKDLQDALAQNAPVRQLFEQIGLWFLSVPLPDPDPAPTAANALGDEIGGSAAVRVQDTPEHKTTGGYLRFARAQQSSSERRPKHTQQAGSVPHTLVDVAVHLLGGLWRGYCVRVYPVMQWLGLRDPQNESHAAVMQLVAEIRMILGEIQALVGVLVNATNRNATMGLKVLQKGFFAAIALASCFFQVWVWYKLSRYACTADPSAGLKRQVLEQLDVFDALSSVCGLLLNLSETQSIACSGYLHHSHVYRYNMGDWVRTDSAPTKESEGLMVRASMFFAEMYACTRTVLSLTAVSVEEPRHGGPRFSPSRTANARSRSTSRSAPEDVNKLSEVDRIECQLLNWYAAMILAYSFAPDTHHGKPVTPSQAAVFPHLRLHSPHDKKHNNVCLCPHRSFDYVQRAVHAHTRQPVRNAVGCECGFDECAGRLDVSNDGETCAVCGNNVYSSTEHRMSSDTVCPLFDAIPLVCCAYVGQALQVTCGTDRGEESKTLALDAFVSLQQALRAVHSDAVRTCVHLRTLSSLQQSRRSVDSALSGRFVEQMHAFYFSPSLPNDFGPTDQSVFEFGGQSEAKSSIGILTTALHPCWRLPSRCSALARVEDTSDTASGSNANSSGDLVADDNLLGSLTSPTAGCCREGLDGLILSVRDFILFQSEVASIHVDSLSNAVALMRRVVKRRMALFPEVEEPTSNANE